MSPNNPERQEVGASLLTMWRNLTELNTPAPTAIENMKKFVNQGIQHSTSDIERITYVEALDLLDQKG
jgi:hypothetical protein